MPGGGGAGAGRGRLWEPERRTAASGSVSRSFWGSLRMSNSYQCMQTKETLYTGARRPERGRHTRGSRATLQARRGGGPAWRPWAPGGGFTSVFQSPGLLLTLSVLSAAFHCWLREPWRKAPLPPMLDEPQLRSAPLRRHRQEPHAHPGIPSPSGCVPELGRGWSEGAAGAHSPPTRDFLSGRRGETAQRESCPRPPSVPSKPARRQGVRPQQAQLLPVRRKHCSPRGCRCFLGSAPGAAPHSRVQATRAAGCGRTVPW